MLNKELLLVFGQYITQTKVNDISFLGFLYFIKGKPIYSFNDRKIYYQLYKDGLEALKVTKNHKKYGITDKKVKEIERYVNVFLNNYEEEKTATEVFLFWAHCSAEKESDTSLEKILELFFQTSNKFTIIKNIIYSVNSIAELDDILYKFGNIIQERKDDITKNTLDNQKLNIINKYVELSKNYSVNPRLPLNDLNILMIKKDHLLTYSMSNPFYCLIIDTYKNEELWKSIFGRGQFKRISNSLNIPTISCEQFYESITYQISNFDDCAEDPLSELDIICKDFTSFEISQTKEIIFSWIIYWKKFKTPTYESYYLFEFLLLPLKLFLGDMLIKFNFETPEHPIYASMERLNNLHTYPFGFLDDDEILNTNFNKRLTKKSDLAISYFPEENDDFKRLYLLVCEAKKPGEKNDDYEKLLKIMRDCYNSWFIYYSKLSNNLSEDKVLFQDIKIYGLHVYDEKIELLVFDSFCDPIGRIRLINDVKIPQYSDKRESPHLIELFWQIKYLLKEFYEKIETLNEKLNVNGNRTYKRDIQVKEGDAKILKRYIYSSPITPKKIQKK